MRRRIVYIVVSLLIMIPATLTFASGGLLSGFPSSAKAGDSVTYTVSPSDESVTIVDASVSPSSGASVSVSGLSFTVTFSEAGNYTVNVSAGDESDSCSVSVASDGQDAGDDSGDSGDDSEDGSRETSGDTSGDADNKGDTSGDADNKGDTSESGKVDAESQKDIDSKGSNTETDVTRSKSDASASKGNKDMGVSSGNSGKGAVTGMSGRGGSGQAASGSSTSGESKTTYLGSADNYLESLKVSGYGFTQDFHKTRNTYFITAESDTTSVDVNAEPADESAQVVVTGQDELSVGRNKVMVSVTADNGDVRVYRIYIDVR